MSALSKYNRGGNPTAAETMMPHKVLCEQTRLAEAKNSGCLIRWNRRGLSQGPRRRCCRAAAKRCRVSRLGRLVFFVPATPSPLLPLPLTENKKVSCTLGCLWSTLRAVFIKHANLFLLLSTSEAGTHLRPPSAPASTGPPGAALMASGRHPASAGKMAQSCH